MKTSKKVLILFSGGLDSTYLMWKNLEEGNTVYPIYVNIGNNENKTKVELQQCKLMIKRFQDAYLSRCRDHHTIMDLTVYGNCNEVSLLQMPIWIMGVIYSNRLADVDEVQIGYVMNDDAISYLDEIKKLYYSFKPLMNLEDKPLPKLSFPLIKEKKWFMYEKLPWEWKNLTFSCENVRIIEEKEIPITNVDDLEEPLKLSPTMKTLLPLKKVIEFQLCGECHPCRRQKAENIFNKSQEYNYDNNLGDDECLEKYPTKLIARSAKIPMKKQRKLPAKKKIIKKV